MIKTRKKGSQYPTWEGNGDDAAGGKSGGKKSAFSHDINQTNPSFKSFHKKQDKKNNNNKKKGAAGGPKKRAPPAKAGGGKMRRK